MNNPNSKRDLRKGGMDQGGANNRSVFVLNDRRMVRRAGLPTWAALGVASALLVAAIPVSTAHAQPASGAPPQYSMDGDAQKVLAAMSTYLGGLKDFSVAYSASDEVVTPQGQKLQFLQSGEIVLQRPDKLYAIRRGATGTAEVFVDGKTLTLFAKKANAYVQIPAPSIDDAIVAVHNLGFDAPGADLLVAKPLDSATTDVTKGAHVGMTTIDGGEVHQLAFRGTDVDWQLWVAAGDRPLPIRYVIATKAISGEPEYTLHLRDWNVAPQIDPGRFTFTPPPGARQLDPSKITADAIGDITIKGE